MFKNIKAVLKGIGSVIVVILTIVLMVVIGPFIMLLVAIAISLLVGYIVYRIDKEAPDLIKDLKEELNKE